MHRLTYSPAVEGPQCPPHDFPHQVPPARPPSWRLHGGGRNKTAASSGLVPADEPTSYADHPLPHGDAHIHGTTRQLLYARGQGED